MIHIHLKNNKKIEKDKTIIEGDIDAVRHGYNKGKKIMKQKTEKVYGTDTVTKKKVFIHEMPINDTQEIELKLVKRLKDSFPDILDFNDNLKELRKLWINQGIQKAIDIVEDLKKSVEEAGYESLSDQSYYNALCDVKIQLNQEIKHE